MVTNGAILVRVRPKVCSIKIIHSLGRIATLLLPETLIAHLKTNGYKHGCPFHRGPLGILFTAIGLGTYSLDGIDGTNAVIEAVRAGYRLLDSAFNYENEGAVGAAVRRSGLPRHELIVTSKLPASSPF